MKTYYAVKLTDSTGRTHHGPLGEGIKLQPGVVVRRRMRQYPLVACRPSAVHVYASFLHADSNDWLHCRHGPRGLLWLVRVTDPVDGNREWHSTLPDKLLAKSYTVVQCIGRLGAKGTPGKCSKLGVLRGFCVDDLTQVSRKTREAFTGHITSVVKHTVARSSEHAVTR